MTPSRFKAMPQHFCGDESKPVVGYRVAEIVGSVAGVLGVYIEHPELYSSQKECNKRIKELKEHLQ